MIKVDLSDMQKELAKLSEYADKLAENIDTALEVGAIEGRNVAADSAPYLTGALKDGIKVNRISQSSYEVIATMPYSAIHEYGGTITVDQVVYIPGVGFRFISMVAIAASGYMAKGKSAGVDKAQELVSKAIDATFKE